MGRGRNKIKSQRGASITFALFLFLMCAMVSAVAIVAATAAGGRLSEIAETDQRYYAVTSAVNMLRDTLDGQVVTIKSTKITNYLETYVNGVLVGDPVQQGALETSISVTLDATATPFMNGTTDVAVYDGASLSNPTPLVEASCYLNPDTKGKYYSSTNPYNKKAFPINITTNNTSDGEKYKSILKVQAYVEEPTGKQFSIYVSKGNDKLSYTLKMNFVADIPETPTKTKVSRGPLTIIKDGATGAVTGYTRMKKEEIITTTTYDWELVSIDKAYRPSDVAWGSDR